MKLKKDDPYPIQESPFINLTIPFFKMFLTKGTVYRSYTLIFFKFLYFSE